jgi:hypothetical protein
MAGKAEIPLLVVRQNKLSDMAAVVGPEVLPVWLLPVAVALALLALAVMLPVRLPAPPEQMAVLPEMLLATPQLTLI